MSVRVIGSSSTTRTSRHGSDIAGVLGTELLPRVLLVPGAANVGSWLSSGGVGGLTPKAKVVSGNGTKAGRSDDRCLGGYDRSESGGGGFSLEFCGFSVSEVDEGLVSASVLRGGTNECESGVWSDNSTRPPA